MKTWIDDGAEVDFNSGVKLGYNVSINWGTFIRGNVEIGDHCLISVNCNIIASEHKYKDTEKIIRRQGINYGKITIEDDVWIGMGTSILPGVTIKEGTIIGAGSVIPKNITIPPYEVWAGNPIKFIKNRELNKKDMVLQARIWSNQELRKIASSFKGDIINVSAWKDEDKEGGHYKDYFSSARSYTITNCSKDKYRGLQNNEIDLDLEGDIPEELIGNFDVVFNHTTLEHLFDFNKAFRNLCSLTKESLILVVPWNQEYHEASDKSYLDYWRFSEEAVKKMFKVENFNIKYISTNGEYIFVYASRN